MELTAQLSQHPLFQGVPDPWLERAAARGSVCTFLRGQTVASPDGQSPGLGVILEGTIQAHRPLAPTGTLAPPEVLGLQFLLTPRQALWSSLAALEDARVAFLPRDTVLELLEGCGPFAVNYVRCLSQLACRLTVQLETVTAGTVERRLGQYLLTHASEDMTVTTSATALAQSLSISRASLYRAFDILEREGAIRRERKRIRVLDPQKLPR